MAALLRISGHRIRGVTSSVGARECELLGTDIGRIAVHIAAGWATSPRPLVAAESVGLQALGRDKSMALSTPARREPVPARAMLAA